MTDWIVCNIVRGIGTGGLRTGARVVCRVNACGNVEVVGRHDTTAVLRLRAAQQCLECVRDRNWRPVKAANQGRLSVKWDVLRGGRSFRDQRRGVLA